MSIVLPSLVRLSILPMAGMGVVAPIVGLLVATGLAHAGRSRPALMGAAAGLACLLGWWLLVDGSWELAVWPRSVLDRLLLPAAGVAVAGMLEGRVRTRWLRVGVALFAAGWLARAPIALPQFWRVWFAGGVIAWVLSRFGARQPSRAVAVSLAVWGGLLASGVGGTRDMVALVWLAGAVGTLAGERLGLFPPVLTMMGVMAADLGAGRLVSGDVNLVDLVCAGALAAPVAVPVVQRRLSKRPRWVAAALAPPLVSAGVVALAWIVLRVIRVH